MQQQADTNSAVDAVLAGSRGALDAATKWQEELLRFFSKRMNGYMEFTAQLRQCRSPGDLLQIQSNFWLQMFSDYRAEAEWLTKEFLAAQKPAQRGIEQSFHSYEETVLRAQRDAAKIIDLAKDQAAQILDNAEARSARNSEEPATRRGKKTAQG